MVWYGARKSKKSKIFRAKSGTVVGVFLNLEDMQKGYKVKSDTSDDDHHEIALYEDKLVYGMNCPVKVKDPDSNREIDGVIVCPKLEDDQNKVSYVVKFSEGRKVKMEFLVANERVRYREEETNNSESIGQKKSIGGEEDEKEEATAVEEAAAPKNADALQEQKSANEEEEMKQPAATFTAPAATANTRRENAVAVAPNEYAMLAGGAPFTVRPPVKHVERVSGGAGLPSERNIASRWNPPTPKKTLERKRSYELGAGSSTSLEGCTSSSLVGLEREERPKKKMAKTEADEAEKPGNDVTCTLTIPSWVYNINGGKKYALFYHLIGSEYDGKGVGYKQKLIESKAHCKVKISGKHEPMKIDITSSSHENVAKGISMIEESLVDFISDENSSIRMLYDLIWSAEGSFKVKRNDGCNMVYREMNGIQSWSALIDLPYKEREEERKEYHGKFLTRLELPLAGDCVIELFGDTFDVPLAYTSPFVLIRGTKHKDVKDAVLQVREKMKRHQGRGCGCTPKW